jgi:uncharacterized protein (TIGR02466 family)
MNESSEISVATYFPSNIYFLDKPEFLESAKTVAEEYLFKSKQTVEVNEIYPVVMTESFYADDRIRDLVNMIGMTSKQILASQGYDMNSYSVRMNELWCQEHHKYSGQEEHIHPHCQISGFYFLDCPENCSKIMIHDPRPAKQYATFLESDSTQGTYASTMINFDPKPGMLMFTNSWLPHSFTKNGSEQSFKFIHFNLGINYKGTCSIPNDHCVQPTTSSATIV